ncbi:MAG: superoxide dismutase [Actinomycetota bacterium]
MSLIQAPRRLAALTAVAAGGVLAGLLVAMPAAQAHPRLDAPVRWQLPKGFQPEGITTGREANVYVGSLVDGAIWRGNARTRVGSVFIPGVAGRVAVGVDYDKRSKRVWVAGGPTGVVTAYDATTGAELMRYVIPGAGFLNDLVVTRKAVYITDSFVQRLVVIPLGEHGALPAPLDVKTLALTGDMSFVAGAFNANGIVASEDGRMLVVVVSSTHTLFRVNPRNGESRVIPLTGGALTDGDGLELHGHTLYVVRGTANAVVVVKLGEHLRKGKIVATLTDPSLDVPATGALVDHRLFVTNPRFSTPVTPTTEYWLTQLSVQH